MAAGGWEAIYENMIAHRDGYQNLANSLRRLADIKSVARPLTTWYRRRHKYVENTLIPLREIAKKEISDNAYESALSHYNHDLYTNSEKEAEIQRRVIRLSETAEADQLKQGKLETDRQELSVQYSSDVQRVTEYQELLSNVPAEQFEMSQAEDIDKLWHTGIAEALAEYQEEKRYAADADSGNLVNALRRAMVVAESWNEEHIQPQKRKLDELTMDIAQSVQKRREINFEIEEAQSTLKDLQKHTEALKAQINDTQRSLAIRQEIITECDKLIGMLQVSTSKDLNTNAITDALSLINEEAEKRGVDTIGIPPNYPIEEITDFHQKIRDLVASVDGLYKMKSFDDADKVLRLIIHDIGNNRGTVALTNRSGELVNAANSALSRINSQYWQISGVGMGRNNVEYSRPAISQPIASIN